MLGAFYSADEIIVDPREAIRNIPLYLSSKFNVNFHWGKCVSSIQGNEIYVGKEIYKNAELVFVCSGADFETLYPEVFSSQAITKCKLQMMRLGSEKFDKRIGPALCGGLSLIHYKSFMEAASLNLLKKRYEVEMEDYLKWGIHVMVSQNKSGIMTVGDSHEYALTFDPFDRDFINRMILNYLSSFMYTDTMTLQESWNGIYAKSTDGATELILNPAPGVFIVNALGGAGMTLSFGLSEEIVSTL